jgi:murein DD-endopeptidase MepM/ murein hydrolase activator NlpD
MLYLMMAFAAASVTAKFDAAPPEVRQGETIRITSSVRAGFARMNSRKVRLFEQPDGTWQGLMPVAVNDAAGRYTIEILESSGAVMRELPVTVQENDFPEQNIRVSKRTQSIRPSRGELAAVGDLTRALTNRRYWQAPFRLPVVGCMNSPFGVQRLHNGVRTGNYHKGVDQRSPARRPVRAITGGVVQLSRMFNLHGGTIGIDHGQGLTSIYIHLSRLAVKQGTRVRPGQLIGYVGSTGFATGPHLHWGMYVNGVSVDPRQWVSLEPCDAP